MQTIQWPVQSHSSITTTPSDITAVSFLSPTPSIDLETTVSLEQCQTRYMRRPRTIPLHHGYRSENWTWLLSRLALVTVSAEQFLSFNLHATDLAQRTVRRCSSTGNFNVSGRTELIGNRNKSLTRNIYSHFALLNHICCSQTPGGVSVL